MQNDATLSFHGRGGGFERTEGVKTVPSPRHPQAALQQPISPILFNAFSSFRLGSDVVSGKEKDCLCVVGKACLVESEWQMESGSGIVLRKQARTQRDGGCVLAEHGGTEVVC